MSTDPDQGRAPRLRPRVTDGLISAVIEDLADVGYGALTMESVARRAGASKATLYRRWSSKQEMVLDAVASVSQPSQPAEDVQDLRVAVATALRGVADWIGEPMMRRILPDLLAEGLRSETMGRALTTHVGQPRRSAVEQMLARATEAGLVTRPVHVELLVDLVAAPIYWRICGLRSEVDDEYLDELTDLVLRYLGVEAP